MYCTYCGTKIPKQTKFCPQCGTDLSQNKNKSNKSKSATPVRKKGIRIPMPVAVFFGIIVVALFVVLIQRKPGTAQNSDIAPLANQWNAQVLSVAQQFTCPCGICNDNMSVCDCTDPGGAVEAKNFIREGLQEGKTTDQMAMAVALKYNISPVTTSE